MILHSVINTHMLKVMVPIMFEKSECPNVGNDSLYTRMSAQPFYKENQTDPELEHKVKKFADKLSETVNIIANEPSLAFFRIQEHVRKTLPQLVDQKHEVEDIQAKVQGSCFDAEYATKKIVKHSPNGASTQQLEKSGDRHLQADHQLLPETSEKVKEKNRKEKTMHE
ncbi:BLOC-1-related complex subunit 8 homolog isoform X6 [Biomphalaria glabrata]|uniref:BLOC-1-related complex subunit 8 homolog isoform X6 n=1 Tax=Biomphalaria glabrata TaxID=6526 RepID=A0A9W3B8N5_BIOGL|nr:BLOC-1-related complex subunit 8 homolog isoform X6 [Biomphalaria glabrata]